MEGLNLRYAQFLHEAAEEETFVYENQPSTVLHFVVKTLLTNVTEEGFEWLRQLEKEDPDQPWSYTLIQSLPPYARTLLLADVNRAMEAVHGEMTHHLALALSAAGVPVPEYFGRGVE